MTYAVMFEAADDLPGELATHYTFLDLITDQEEAKRIANSLEDKYIVRRAWVIEGK